MEIQTAFVSPVAAFWTELEKKNQPICCSLLNSTSWYFAREYCLIPKQEFWLFIVLHG